MSRTEKSKNFPVRVKIIPHRGCPKWLIEMFLEFLKSKGFERVAATLPIFEREGEEKQEKAIEITLDCFANQEDEDESDTRQILPESGA